MSADQISSNVLTDPVCQISLLVVSLLNTGGKKDLDSVYRRPCKYKLLKIRVFIIASLLPLSLFVEVVVSVVTLRSGASRLHLPSIVDSEQKCTNVFVRPLGHFLWRKKKKFKNVMEQWTVFKILIPAASWYTSPGICCQWHIERKEGRAAQAVQRQLQTGIIMSLNSTPLSVFLLILPT